MKTADFIRKHKACRDGAKWALSVSDDMADVWDALVEQEKHEWLLWVVTRPGVFPDSVPRKLACRCVRETPLVDGRTVWDLLTDERSRNAVEVAELYVDGKATKKELADAADAANAAAWASDDASDDAADYAAAWASNDASDDAAARAAAWAADAAYSSAPAAARAADADCAAKSAQVQMVAQLGNPFKKEAVK